MANPTTAIRESFWYALNSTISAPIFVDNIPLGVDPLPSVYVLISGQSKQERSICKRCPNLWTCSITLDVISVTDASQNNRLLVDNVEQEIYEIVNKCSDFQVEGFSITNMKLLNTLNADVDIDTQNLDRQIVTYEMQIEEL